MRVWSLRIPAQVLVVFLFSLFLEANFEKTFAQSDLGKISGFILDQSGAPVPNAKITVRNQSGIERQAATNDTGYYVISNVPPGFYVMTAEAPGFRKFESTNNKLDSASDLVVNATMTLGSITETVEVTASTAQLQTESAAVQKLVTREQIDSLELNGRNPVLMANLVPGTRGGTLASLSFNFSQGPSNINGARTPDRTAVVCREDPPGDPGHRCRRIVRLRGLRRRVASRRLQRPGTRRLGRERTGEGESK